MPRLSHRFALVLTGPEKKDLGQHPFEGDWLPAREAVQFESLKRFGGAGAPIRDSDLAIEPVFSTESGEPWVESIAVTGERNGQTIRLELPNASFVRSAARLVTSRMVEEKKVEAGDLVTYQIVAFPQAEHPPSPHSPFAFEEQAILPPLRESSEIVGLHSRSIPSPADPGGEKGRGPDSFPVFVPQSIFSEIRASSEADTVETGGLLIGVLHRFPAMQTGSDAGEGEFQIAAEVTAQLPAQYTEATETSLRFTDESWVAADTAIRLRQRTGITDEIVLGWWHSHPSKSWCPEACPVERRLECPKQAVFFSSDDISLHREIFPKAYHFALLANVADAGTTVTGYGWRAGTVTRVPYRILDPDTTPSSESPDLQEIQLHPHDANLRPPLPVA